jgi:hypothetical protein
MDKFNFYSRGLIKNLNFKKLFDKNELTKLQKMLFKNSQTFKTEDTLLSLKRHHQLIADMFDQN